MTLSIFENEKRRIAGFFASFISSFFASAILAGGSDTASFTLFIKSKISSAPSSLSNTFRFLLSKSAGEGANFENLVSSSSGSSTFVIMSTIESEDVGIASIIKGISSASKPNSAAACCIISWKSDFAFSVP